MTATDLIHRLQRLVRTSEISPTQVRVVDLSTGEFFNIDKVVFSDEGNTIVIYTE